MSFDRIAVIYNPHSGRPRERNRAIERFCSLLRAAGRQVAVCPTERPNHATDLARQKAAEGFDLILAYGGDGTMNEVLQGVVGSKATLGFWPGGTANVLAAEIRFPSRIEEVVRRVLAGRTLPVTVGKANDRYFLLMAGVGLDAAVAGSVDPWLKRRFGKVAFGVAALKFMWQWQLRPFMAQVPDENPVIGRFLVAGNAHSYGGGFQLTPQAELTDPYIDLCIFTGDGRGAYLRYALAALVGWHRQMPGVVYRKVKAVEITNASRRKASYQLDGEVVGELPLKIEAIPEGVSLLV